MVRDAKTRRQVVAAVASMREQGEAFAVIQNAVCIAGGNERRTLPGDVALDRIDLRERLLVEADYVAQPR